MRIVRSLYARSKLEKYHESTNVIGKKSIYLRQKSGYEAKLRQKRSLKSWLVEFVITRKKVCAHDKKGLRSRQKGFALTTKKVCAHDKKGFISRAQTPHLDFHSSIACARAHVFVIFAF